MLPHPADPGKMIPMISLDRQTESECMVVKAGSCDSSNPSLTSESLRLAYMSLDESHPPSQASPVRSTSMTTGTSSSKSTKSGSDRAINGSSSSNQSSRGLEEAAFSKLGGISESDAQGLNKGHANGNKLDRDCNPQFGSPFSNPVAQQGSFDIVSKPHIARGKLNAMAIDARLFTELSSLPSDDLAFYLQVAENITAFSTAKDSSPATNSEMATLFATGSPSVSDIRQIQDATKKLAASLPVPSLEKLQPFKYYGLLDIMNGPTQ